MAQENEYYSYNLKTLPKGCQYCVKGEKMVLFVTGICPRKCYFCPVSDNKFGKDNIYANERKGKTPQDVIAEAKLMRAKGAGITGGDPLSRLDRTVEYITLFKQEFGKDFHIHLYTSLNLVTEKTLQKLFDAGLDEIRFHLDLESEKLWGKIALATSFSWDVGCEIPLIPTKEVETKKLIDFIHDKVSFLNLNELEVADNELSKLTSMGLKTKNSLSYAVEGSISLGIRLLEYVEKKGYLLAVHACTAKLKDGIQLTNRLKRESENAQKAFDRVDDEGLLIRGALYLPELAPGFEYRKKLESLDLKQVVTKLIPTFEKVKSELKLEDEEIFLDEAKPRILLSVRNLKKNKEYFHGLGLLAAKVTEYPTADQLEMEVEFV